MQVADNQTGFVQVGQDFPYATVSDGTGKAKVEHFQLGFSMRVTPRISPDGKVLLRVEPRIATVSPTPVNLGNGITAPAFNVNTFQATTRLQDGQTLILSGGVSRQVSAVVTDGERKEQEIRRETLIILTPHIVKNEARRAAVLKAQSCVVPNAVPVAPPAQWQLPIPATAYTHGVAPAGDIVPAAVVLMPTPVLPAAAPVVIPPRPLPQTMPVPGPANPVPPVPPMVAPPPLPSVPFTIPLGNSPDR
jgi:hypothetical protein